MTQAIEEPDVQEFEREWTHKMENGIAPSPDEVVMRYAHYVSEFDLTPEQEREFIHTFWNIMQTLVCVRLGLDPVSVARGSKPASTKKCGADMISSTPSTDRKTDDKKNNAGRAFAMACAGDEER